MAPDEIVWPRYRDYLTIASEISTSPLNRVQILFLRSGLVKVPVCSTACPLFIPKALSLACVVATPTGCSRFDRTVPEHSQIEIRHSHRVLKIRSNLPTTSAAFVHRA